MTDSDEKAIRRELKIDARAIGIPSGAATIFIDRTISDAKKYLATKNTITKKTVKHAIYRELKKYNTDLAYVYQNRDTII